MRESLAGPHGVAPTAGNVMGVLSLVFWSLVLVVVIKYIVLVMRADNRGEGGILALVALLLPPEQARLRRRLPLLVLLGLFGCGLLLGDGIITPVISVLSAVEGLEVVVPEVRALVVPITIGILLALFAVQRHGTHRIGRYFGPIMLLWFVAIGVTGGVSILGRPDVLAAVHPRWAVRFFVDGGSRSFWALGAIVLAVTGAEALYADMGHFGRHPIRTAWTWIVFPGVLLSYFGQGAFLLDHGPVGYPLFEALPGPLVVPMVVLATAATVIASQALIASAFSLVHQAVQLGYLPRVHVVHTSADAEGQIYLPGLNALLAVACVAVALGFRTSSALAAAFGIAVSSTMAITTVLLYQLARERWRWSTPVALAIIAPLVAVDVVYTVANLRKFKDGGWLPLAVGALVFATMTTWWRGSRLLARAMEDASLDEDLFLDQCDRRLQRTPGTGVFMTSTPRGVPNVLLHLLKNVRALPEQVVLLSVLTEPTPWVPGNDAITVTPLRHGLVRVVARIGFMQTPAVPRLLARAAGHGLDHDEAATTYFLGRTSLVIGKARTMSRWRKRFFGVLVRNARPPALFFGLPANRTIELGLQIET